MSNTLASLMKSTPPLFSPRDGIHWIFKWDGKTGSPKGIKFWQSEDKFDEQPLELAIDIHREGDLIAAPWSKYKTPKKIQKYKHDAHHPLIYESYAKAQDKHYTPVSGKEIGLTRTEFEENDKDISNFEIIKLLPGSGYRVVWDWINGGEIKFVRYLEMSHQQQTFRYLEMSHQQQTFTSQQDKYIDVAGDDDHMLDVLDELLKNLPTRYADDFTLWQSVLFGFKHICLKYEIDENAAIGVFEEFSRRTTNPKYLQDIVIGERHYKQVPEQHNKPTTLGTLLYYLREENPDFYEGFHERIAPLPELFDHPLTHKDIEEFYKESKIAPKTELQLKQFFKSNYCLVQTNQCNRIWLQRSIRKNKIR